jgi:NADH:ubiquinone oxidoreductase subunit F (NADH-binding)/(2Fe-2S) ferredoxin
MAKLTPETLIEFANNEAAANSAEADTDKGGWIKVGLSTCGIAAGAEPVFQAIADGLRARGVGIDLRKTGCVGSCYQEPLVEVNVPDSPRTMYGNVSTADVEQILNDHIGAKAPVEERRVSGVDALGFDDFDLEAGKPGRQFRIVLRNCGVVDPNKIEDYIGRGGYQGLARALELGPQGVIGEVRKSGIRGRGGAGYPTHFKWEFTRRNTNTPKYMICNADEGDPGAYMDRSVLEGDPHSVIEGMIIAGLAIGAEKGYFYIRAEYPLAIERVENAIKQAKRLGLLGRKILGSEFNYDLEVRLGAGAFVCGEETALMASLEGRRGTPNPRPPFPSEKGLWGQPSNINNVETLANIPVILTKGGDWFASIGTRESTGTKVFAVTGKVANSGLIEVPMGTTLRQIVFDICGGVADGAEFKAVQTGGPSGGVIPFNHIDTPVTYEDLSRLGSIMGSGGMIVMDSTDNMVEIAQFYMGFSVDESCGKCAPCRVGCVQMLRILDRLIDGRGRPDDVGKLHQLSRAMQKASLCGLGQSAPNPVVSTLRYFGFEYDDAIAQAGAVAH